MGKSLFIAEKPSVAQEFAKALKENTARRDGYLEGEHIIVTWCVGHLVTMSYPEVYDEKYKKWRLDTLPFLPETFKYEVIKNSAKQYKIVSGLLNRPDVDTIYVCTDSGREGEYIYRLVAQMAGVKDKTQKRVWIDSQTEDEILRGIREAKDESEYDNLSAAAYLRAKEDFLMGINFSRLLTIKYGNPMANFLHEKYCVISIGRVMTCVLGMVVRREREIRDFVKTPFYRVLGDAVINAGSSAGESEDFAVTLPGMEWRAVEGSRYKDSRLLYKENGFREKPDAIHLIEELSHQEKNTIDLDENAGYECKVPGVIHKIGKKKEKKNPPLLYNLAEIQNDCSKFFKISPDETLKVIQELYEKKLVTYPRTDARVLSTAVAKEIDKNIRGLMQIPGMKPYAEEILSAGTYKNIAKTRYTDDKKITDHYALIPTGQGIGGLSKLPQISVRVYELIVRRFLAIFYDAAVYEKLNLTVKAEGEFFFAADKYLVDPGYLKVMNYSWRKKKADAKASGENAETGDDSEEENNAKLQEVLPKLKKNDPITISRLAIKEGETSPPKRYNSGSMILAMENAGQLIEDEELRAQIKSSGIGTSATRAEILNKLVRNKYLALNKKTQIITPTLMGEMIFDVVTNSMPQMLNPELTASWEKGLTYVAEGTITEEEYMQKLEAFIRRRTDVVLSLQNQYSLQGQFQKIAQYYK